MAAKLSLTAADLAHIDGSLGATDALLERNYPGDDGSRQPVHTVYVPADKFTPALAADWGQEALSLASDHGGLERLGTLLGQNDELAAAVAPGSQPSWPPSPSRTCAWTLKTATETAGTRPRTPQPSPPPAP